MLPGVKKGLRYARPDLAKKWGYSGYQALARGVVTPRNSNVIILFVTEEKQPSAEPYLDRLAGNRLNWEGPKDHFAEDRILAAKAAGDEIHVFHRPRHHQDFTYCGLATLIEYKKNTKKPSRFVFEI